MQVQVEVKSKGQVSKHVAVSTDLFDLARKYGAHFDHSNVSVQRTGSFTRLVIYPNGPFRAADSRIVLYASRKLAA